MKLARRLSAGLFGAALLGSATVGAQLTVDAGPDRTVAVPGPLSLSGTVSGRTPLDFWSADGNGTEENKLIKYDSDTGVSYAGPIMTTSGTLYGFVNDIVDIDGTPYGVAPLLRRLFVLDGDTGIATNVGAQMSAPSIRGLAWDRIHRILYGVDYSNNALYRIDPTTAVSTKVVSSVGHTFTTCLAYQESTGLLYAYGESTDWLFTIDPTTGVLHNVVQLPTTSDETYDELQFYQGELYGMWWRYSTFDAELRKIDIATGSYQVVASLTDVTTHSLLVNSVPEPVTWSVESGPAPVAFSDPDQVDTDVTFSVPGLYRLALVATTAQGPVKDTLDVQVLSARPLPNVPGIRPTAMPLASFANSAVTVGEGATTVHATVQLSAPSTDSVTVPITFGGTATPSTDYTASPNPIVIGAGLVSADVVVTVNDDSLDEDDETIQLTLGRPTNAALGKQVQDTVTILDDDDPPTVELSAASQSVGEAAGMATVTLQLSAPSGRAIQVPYTLAGTATLPDDYSISPPSPITIAPGDTRVDLELQIVPDSVDETDETVVITLGTPTDATLGATVQHTATILDDDGPTVTLSPTPQYTSEGAGTVGIAFLLSASSPQAITVPFSLSGTAVSPDDYTTPASPLVIPAGQASGSLAVTVVQDTLDEDDETVHVTLGTPTHAKLGTTTAHDLTILDDDASPSVHLASAAQSVGEGVGTATIAVQISAVSGRAVSVPYTLGGTATQGADYQIPASPLIVPAGQASANLVVTVLQDSVFEGNETVVVTLGTPTNATLGSPSVHTLTIVDDDPAMLTAQALEVDPSEVAREVGEEVPLSVTTQGVGQLTWTVSSPDAGRFLESDGTVVLSPPAAPRVHFLAGATPGTFDVDVFEPETGRAGRCTVIVAPLVYDVTAFATLPSPPRSARGGIGLWFDGETTVVGADAPFGVLVLRPDEGPRSLAPRSAPNGTVRALAGTMDGALVALAETPAGERSLLLLDLEAGRVRVLNPGWTAAWSPLPLLAAAPEGGLWVGSSLLGGTLLRIDPAGRAVAARRTPPALDPEALRGLVVAPDGALVLAAPDSLERLDPRVPGATRLGTSLSPSIAALALDDRGRLAVATTDPAGLHVLDAGGAELLAISGTEGGAGALGQPFGRPLALASGPHGELLLLCEDAASATGPARLWLATPRPDGARPRLAITPDRSVLRPGSLQELAADVPATASVTWTTETGVFLDTRGPVSHANPAVLLAGARAGRFPVTLATDLPGHPGARATVEVSDLPLPDAGALHPASLHDRAR